MTASEAEANLAKLLDRMVEAYRPILARERAEGFREGVEAAARLADETYCICCSMTHGVGREIRALVSPSAEGR